MRTTALVLATLCLAAAASAQPSLRDERGDRSAERKTVLRANEVGLTVFNYGLSGGVGEVRGNWPIGSNDFYVGDLMFVAVAEVTDDTGARVRIASVPRGPSNRGIPADPNDPNLAWTWEAVPGYASDAIRADTGQPNSRVATANDPLSWPDVWPDRAGDALDPGWPGAWDGLWGKNVFVDGDEVYSHLADDNVGGDLYTPDPADPSRGGLGLVTKQRVLALDEPGFEDAVVYVWDVVNTSPRDLSDLATGFVVGTLSGGDGDSQDDVAGVDEARGMVYSYDFDNRGNQGQPVGYTGFVFLPTPGGGHDLGAALHVVPSNIFPLSRPDQIWTAVQNGIDVPDCAPGGGCDGDLYVSTAPFLLPAFAETRVSAAVVFGRTLADIQRKADDLRAFAASGLRFDGDAIAVTGPGNVTTVGSVTVSWTSADPQARVRLDAFRSGEPMPSLLANDLPASGSFVFDAAARGPGVYVVRATAASSTGFGRDQTGQITVVGSTGAPFVSLNAPRGAVRGTVAVPYETGSVSGNPLSVRLLDVFADTRTVIADGLAPSGTVQWDTRAAPNGIHRLRLEASDGVRVSSVESDVLVVANVRPALLAPGTYAGLGGGSVEVRAADASATTGHAYRVDFSGPPLAAETYTVTDETTGSVVLGATPIPSAPIEGPLVDGLRLVVRTPATEIDRDASGWTAGAGQYALSLRVASSPAIRLEGVVVPYDYALAFADAPVTQSLGGIRIGTASNAPLAVAQPVNLTVTNTTLGRTSPFVFVEQDGTGGLFTASVQGLSARSDVVIVYECVQPGGTCTVAELVPTYSIIAEAAGPPLSFPGRAPVAGDVFGIRTVKAIQDGDTYRFEARFVVDGEDGPRASALRLARAVPNPARSRTTLRFSLPDAGPVRLRLFDALGREVAMLADADYAAGEHTVAVDAARLVSGLYLARLDAGDRSETQRFVVVR